MAQKKLVQPTWGKITLGTFHDKLTTEFRNHFMEHQNPPNCKPTITTTITVMTSLITSTTQNICHPIRLHEDKQNIKQFFSHRSIHNPTQEPTKSYKYNTNIPQQNTTCRCLHDTKDIAFCSNNNKLLSQNVDLSLVLQTQSQVKLQKLGLNAGRNKISSMNTPFLSLVHKLLRIFQKWVKETFHT